MKPAFDESVFRGCIEDARQQRVPPHRLHIARSVSSVTHASLADTASSDVMTTRGRPFDMCSQPAVVDTIDSLARLAREFAKNERLPRSWLSTCSHAGWNAVED